MKKLITLIVLYCVATKQVAAQYIIGANTKYYGSAIIGWLDNFGTFGDKTTAKTFGASSIKNSSKTFGVNFGIKAHSKYSVGLEFIYDEFNCGYKVVNTQNGGRLQNPVKGTPYFRSKLTPFFTAGIF